MNNGEQVSIAEPNIFWEQLLQLIEEGRVIPVVGQDLLTVSDAAGSGLLYPYLAARLAEYFDLPAENLPAGAELNEVACRYLAQGNPVEEIYPALKTIAVNTDSLPFPTRSSNSPPFHPFSFFSPRHSILS